MKPIQTALISVFHKDGLDNIVELLKERDIQVYSTGGTQQFLENLGIGVLTVEGLTGYPSILDGRVKTLHPKVFGGILARNTVSHESQLQQFGIPRMDLVIVDLYPFEKTLETSNDENEIIEKIDIGGISLIRAAAKNYSETVVISSQAQYPQLERILAEGGGKTDLTTRKNLAYQAFRVSSHYDNAIAGYFNRELDDQSSLSISISQSSPLRYGENPHQKARYFGNLDLEFQKLNGKEISFNNLVDIDAAIELMNEFQNDPVSFAILKHTNVCGIATRDSAIEAYLAALAGDPVSAFGGILICNAAIDIQTAMEIDRQFYEVLIAPHFEENALELLSKKKNRILLKRLGGKVNPVKIKTALGGLVVQDADIGIVSPEDLQFATNIKPDEAETDQLLFAIKVSKHLKSNTIVLARDFQLLGMGCGQTSRIDACKQAIDKAEKMGFSLTGAVLASDAFFPFPDCVEIAHQAGIRSFVQPGGSINDNLSIDYCNQNGLCMVLTGRRHFKH